MSYSDWEDEIRALEASPAPPAPIAFYGSSTMRQWESVAADFADKTVANRGFGGSNVDEAAQFVARLILPLLPRQVVFYSGENDLAQGKSVAQIVRDYQNLLATIRTASDAPILFISVKPSPGRWELKPSMDEINVWLAAWCAGDASLTFVDVVAPMLQNGKPREELWVEDGVHLTRAGYKLWAEILRPHLI